MNTSIPTRRGERPTTTSPTPAHPRPHQQVDQIAPDALQDELFARASRLPHVQVGKSLISLPDARAFHLESAAAQGPAQAFQRRTEFAHIHGAYDGSLHLTLPPDVYQQVLDTGWGEPHPLSKTMMLFGPRDADELETVWQIVLASYHYARGTHSAG